MKATITYSTAFISIFLFLFLPHSFSQKSSFIPDELIVDLSQTSDLEGLRTFQKEIGALVIKEDKGAQLELWKIPRFPVFTEGEDNKPLYNIIDILNHTYGDKPGVNEFGLNYVLEGPANVADILEHFELEKYTPSPYCPGFTPGIPLNADNQPNIAIIDSGVDHYTIHSLFSQYNLVLSESNNFTDSIPFIPIDKHGHGTQIMGAIMGTLSAWEVPSASFIPYKVIDKNGQGNLFSLLQAIYKTAADGVDVVNMSLGFYPDPQDFETIELVHKAMLALEERGILAIVAAGNSSESLDEIDFLPATSPTNRKIIVAASACQDSLAKFSNYGAASVHIAAPGTDILCPTINSAWVLANGSSYSAAITTAFAAALFSINDDPNPAIIECSLLNGVIPNSSLSEMLISGGILDAGTLLDQFYSSDCMPNTPPTVPMAQIMGLVSNTMMYPNPTRGISMLRLDSKRGGGIQFHLFDLNGRRLQTFKEELVKGINEISVDLSRLKPGIYYLSSPYLGKIRIVKQ